MQNDWIQDTITVDDGIEIFYTRTGGEKPPIILAHGITDSGDCWIQLANDLEADYDVIMYDAYGHGKSSRINADKRFDLTADLHDLIKTLDLNKPGVIGHSMGAVTAVTFAAKYPDMLSALVLEDPPLTDQKVDITQVKTTMQSWKEKNLIAKEKTIKDLIKQKKKETPNREEAILKAWAQAKIDVDPAVFDHYPVNNLQWREMAKSISCPTLIVTGDKELGAIVTPKLGVEIVQLLAKGEFGHISGAGHSVHYDQYQPFLTMVRLFLKRNIPS